MRVRALSRASAWALLGAMLVGGCASGGAGRAAHEYERAAVATDHVAASEAGVEVLSGGGNAVDAAVAASFTLSVARPYSCGIGGGGFMVIHLPRDPVHGGVTAALNYRETAPARVGPEYFERHERGSASTIGASAVGVPGTVAGLLAAQQRYGVLPLEEVLGPAIRAAERGFRIDSHFMDGARELIAWYDAAPARKERFPFVWERHLRGGRVTEGDRIRLPEQAEALRLIAREGASAVYEGAIGEAIIRAVERDGGAMTREDLRAFEPRWVDPVGFEFDRWRVLSMPPPSSGGVAMGQILGLLERRGVGAFVRRGPEGSDWHDAEGLFTSLLVEAMKHAFADRATHLGDPEHVAVPVRAMLSPARLSRVAERVRPGHPEEIESYGVVAPPGDDAGTSHLCVVDRWGGAVSCTETINTTFGSRLGVPEYGFVLNNEMDDFTARAGEPNAYGLIQSSKNAPGPGKRPISSMSPTIVVDGRGEVVAVAGASGGPRIISATAQALLDVLVLDATAADAVARARVHHQWLPDTLFLEPAWFAQEHAAWRDRLEEYGYELARRETIGVVQLIRRTSGGWQAASDPRKGGRPRGY